MINATNNGMKFRLTNEKGETLAISAVAIITPLTGETVLPIEADSCIGKIRLVDSTA